jgi:aminoglycoside 3-N-acetyltransferase
LSEDATKSLARCLGALGVEASDVLMVHSNISGFLRLPFPKTTQKLGVLLDGLLGAVPTGTLVVPTFSYRFCRTGVFDAATTPSEVGLFSEFVRRDPRSMRSSHPIFSVAAIGPDAAFLCRNLSHSSYGAGSIFERLYVGDAKLLHFDVTIADSCTFAHFPEQAVGVPYRYSKHFHGTATVDGEAEKGDWELYVRATERWEFPPQPADEMRYPKELQARGLSKTVTWEGLTLTLTSCRAVYDVVSSGIRSDPHYLLCGPLRRKS